MTGWEFGAVPAGRPAPSDGDRRQLIMAAVGACGDAAAAWRAWSARHDVADIDAASLAILPAVYARLRGTDAIGPSAPKLAGLYRWSWVRNQIALRSAATMAARLAAAGIPVVALKGIALIASCYLDLGARLLIDADLLVAERQALDAASVLMAEGWIPQRALPCAALVPYLYSLTFSDGRGGSIDLHWKPLPMEGPPGGWDGLRARAIDASVGETWLRVPAPEDLLLLSILHATRPDAQAGLRWALDVATIGRNPSLDWSAVRERAAAWGFASVVRRALQWVSAATGVVPQSAITGSWPEDGPGDDRRRRFLRTFSDARRGMPAIFNDHRWLHRDVHERRGSFEGRLPLHRYVFEYYRYAWETKGIRDTLTRAVRRAVSGVEEMPAREPGTRRVFSLTKSRM